MLRGTEDDLQALPASEKPNQVKFSRTQEDCLSPSPLCLRRNQVVALAPGIWAEVLCATTIMALRHPLAPIFSSSPLLVQRLSKCQYYTPHKTKLFSNLWFSQSIY